MLHLFLRITECLLRFLFEVLNESDICSSSSCKPLTERPNMNIFLNFLKNECKIYGPFYIKNHDNGEIEIKLRSLNSNELESFYKNIGHVSLRSLFPHLVSIRGISFILLEFFEIYELMKISVSQESITEIEQRLSEWSIVYCQLGSLNSTKFTPYIHIFLHHITDFIKLHGCINFFNCQGLEKLNHLIKLAYFSNSNKHSKVYLKQLLEKRNREEFAEIGGTIEIIDEMSSERTSN